MSLIRSFILIFPSLITLSALACGLSSALFSIDGDFWWSYWCLFASAVLDGLDGHAARALKATSALGAELDSLCDLVDFGVCPGFIIFMWARYTGGQSTADTPWYESDLVLRSSFLFYAACCAFRLARFNLDDKMPVPQPPHSTNFKGIDDPEPKLERRGSSLRSMLADEKAPSPKVTSKTWLDQYINRAKFFQGIPAPAAALLTLMPMVYWLQYGDTHFPVRTVVPIVFFSVGIGMICKLRTFSSKMLIRGAVSVSDPTTSHLRSKSGVTRFLKIAGAAGFLYTYVNHPYGVHMWGTLIYVVTLPVSHLLYTFWLTEPAPPKFE